MFNKLNHFFHLPDAMAGTQAMTQFLVFHSWCNWYLCLHCTWDQYVLHIMSHKAIAKLTLEEREEIQGVSGNSPDLREIPLGSCFCSNDPGLPRYYGEWDQFSAQWSIAMKAGETGIHYLGTPGPSAEPDVTSTCTFKETGPVTIPSPEPDTIRVMSCYWLSLCIAD